VIVKHSTTWAAVAAREDVDPRYAQCPTVVYTPDRGADERLDIDIEMSPSDARKLARALNKAAKRLAS